MIKGIIILLLMAVAGVLVLATMKPDAFHVERSISIKAPPDKVFAQINDFKRWASWSPWEKLDPAMKRTFSGADSGKGAAYAWVGNSDVGEGRMEIVDTAPPTKVTIKLDFVKPLEGHDTAEFVLVPNGDSTNVTWVMNGPSPFVAKVMSVFVSMDKMIGKDFEKGLANLKTVAEQQS